MKRARPTSLRLRPALLPLALLGLAASPYVPWTELTETDWVYSLATRTSTVDGYAVHYPTPTQELSDALAARGDAPAQRHLAEARLELGDRAGAVQALERWAQASGPEAWAEAARWSATHHEWAAAFHAAASALPGLTPAAQRKLADEQIAWADAQPDFADALALRQKRAELFPQDSDVLEEWIRGLEDAGKLAEAEAALSKAPGLNPEARLLIQAELVADHGNVRRAFDLLDGALDPALASDAQAFTQDWWKVYVARVDAGAPASPDAWRAALEHGFDPRALLRLTGYFQGQERGDAVLDLLRQVERRYEASLDRKGWLQLARHYGEIDAVPEAFRARLSAAQKGTSESAPADLAVLVRLALRAGGRPLPWGSYNDEPYRWVARIDRTPGFWTGGIAFLFTGQDWKEALAHLESEALPERTFKVARLLLDELAQRAPTHAELPALRALVMARHVERGEGQAALKLLPLVEAGSPEAARQARRTALLAMRQVEVPLSDEVRLYKAQLRQTAADGTLPGLARPTQYYSNYVDTSLPPNRQRFLRHRPAPDQETYASLLDEAVTRLEQRDPTHRATLDLLLGELDRLPDAEGLWSELAGRLDGWHLDDDLGPRYERALQRFDGPQWWQRLARWYARRARQAELRRLADDLVQRFRGSELFARVRGIPDGVEVPEQPKVGQRIRLVPWADWVRLKALQRFPHSPTVYREALAHVTTPSRLDPRKSYPDGQHPVLTEDALLEAHRYALLFIDGHERDAYMADKMKAGTLAPFLESLDGLAQRTPVEDSLLLDGWARLSQFERAAPAADRLAASYPGDGDIAREALTLHRSLSTLDPAHGPLTRAVVERALPALGDPSSLLTELGELEQERGRGEAARATWAKLVEREPKSAARVEELATILWDYGYMQPALEVVEQGRLRLKEPWLLAFEAGVLREELRDLDGAIREYLGSAKPNRAQCFCDWFEADQRALRRLSQLAASPRVRRKLLDRIASLQPGVAADEQALVALLPLPTIVQPDTSLEETIDDWIDRADQPNDPVGREARAHTREGWLPSAREAMNPIGDALLTRVLLFAPKATTSDFLDKLDEWKAALLDARWAQNREVDFANALLRRHAELAPSEELRVTKEVERARYLLEHGRCADSDALWSALSTRIGALPQGAPRMHAEAERVGYVERTRGAEAAAGEWRALTARYPWSLGLLEDRLSFLNRNTRGAEARQVLEDVAPRAASGHREALLERLAREALEARDLPQARRTLERLLGTAALDESQRLGALHLLARLRLREEPQADLLALAKTEGPKLNAEHQADLYQQLARAADLETRFAAAQALWIEALNRRLERDWVRMAYRSAERAGATAALQAFFERQRERSPRDVRWAVAVREIRLMAHDLDGAIEMAKAAVNVRPERESLWHEASDLMVRAGRPGEAADYLEGWARPRLADESAAGWRSALYAHAGQEDKAMAVEQAALAAFARQAEALPAAEEGASPLNQRRARAARRLVGYGLPQKAWTLLCPTDDPRGLAAAGLPTSEQAQLALANDRYLRWLRVAVEDAGDEDVLTPAASAFLERAKPEQREELLAFLKARLFPAGTRVWPGDTGALRQWSSFAEGAGLEVQLHDMLARRYITTRPGPWNPAAPTALVAAIAGSIVGTDTHSEIVFQAPDVERLWVQYLVERDRAEELGRFLAPRWTLLVARVFDEAPVPQARVPQDWTRWLDDRQALSMFAQSLASQPERRAELQRIFAERRRWDRLWAFGARAWNIGALVVALPDDGRQAWFRLWQEPSPNDADPILKARGQSVEAVSLALGRLVTGTDTAATLADPLIVKLRGPRTVGDVLGHDARWIWPEFTPTAAGSPGRADEGVARVIGNGADAGRLPGLLWGERPGNALYALETLARYREKTVDAALVPLEAPGRGQESERTRLAARLADALGDSALALEIEASGSVSSLDLRRFESQLQRLLLGRAKPAAEDLLRAEVQRRQARLDESTYRALRTLAADLSLTPPFELLDPQNPVAASLLAYLVDSKGSAACAALKPVDVVAFRSALSRRWADKERRLTATDLRFWLDELWATGGSSNLPQAGLPKLGGIWPSAGSWLSTFPQAQRAEALGALRALPDDRSLEAMLQRSSIVNTDVVRLLRLRVRLMKGDEPGALELFEGLLSEVRHEEPLTYAPVTLGESVSDDAEESETPDQALPENSQDALSARLTAWTQPFREVHKLPLVADKLKALLAERRQDGAVAVGAWRLALELATEEERPALIAELENAWIRGDALSPREVAEALARTLPGEVPKWRARWAEDFDYEAVARRARVLIAVNDRDGAANVLVIGRKRGSWTRVDEMHAFDLWRSAAPAPTPGAKLGGTSAPATWAAALPFWKRKASDISAELDAQLARHPCDSLSARAILRTVGPADEEPLRRALLTLEGDTSAQEHAGSDDARFVQLRIARGLLAVSAHAAARQLTTAMTSEAELRARHLPAADIDAALSDTARIATAAGDASRAEQAQAALEDRNPAEGARLHAALVQLVPKRSTRPYRLDANEQPQPIRPRDLDWTLLAATLAAETSR